MVPMDADQKTSRPNKLRYRWTTSTQTTPMVPKNHRLLESKTSLPKHQMPTSADIGLRNRWAPLCEKVASVVSSDLNKLPNFHVLLDEVDRSETLGRAAEEGRPPPDHAPERRLPAPHRASGLRADTSSSRGLYLFKMDPMCVRSWNCACCRTHGHLPNTMVRL